jgi:hypothetical protein
LCQGRAWWNVGSHTLCLTAAIIATFAGTASASSSSTAQQNLNKLLLSKDVRALLELPTYNDGVNIYYTPPSGKRTYGRGLDLGELTKFLKAKGVGTDRDKVDDHHECEVRFWT